MAPSKALQGAFGRSAKDRGRRFTLRAATVHPVSTRRSTTRFCFAIDAPFSASQHRQTQRRSGRPLTALVPSGAHMLRVALQPSLPRLRTGSPSPRRSRPVAALISVGEVLCSPWLNRPRSRHLRQIASRGSPFVIPPPGACVSLARSRVVTWPSTLPRSTTRSAERNALAHAPAQLKTVLRPGSAEDRSGTCRHLCRGLSGSGPAARPPDHWSDAGLAPGVTPPSRRPAELTRELGGSSRLAAALWCHRGRAW